jgi:HK97 family phage portal protein
VSAPVPASPAVDALTAAIREAVDARERLVVSPWELPIVAACRSLISETLGQLGMLAYRGAYPITTQPAILARPDPDETCRQTIARFHDNLTGPGYVWLRPTAFYANDLPAAVQVIDAPNATATYDVAGHQLEVWWNGDRYEAGNLLPGHMLHVPFRQTRAGTLGVGPLHESWALLEHVAGLWEMATSYWEAGFPSMSVVVEQVMTATQRREMSDELDISWRRSHKPAVVSHGARLEPIGANAVEAQLVESIAAMDKQIARLFGVPPSIVNVDSTGSLTYSTTEGELSRWLKLGAGGYIARQEDAFSAALPLGQTARVSTGELLRTDQNARADWYAAGLAGGWLTVDEIRTAEGLQPLATLEPHAPAGAFDMAPQPKAET